MRKFGFFAAIAVILAGFGGWLASTSQARLVGPIVTGPQIDAMQIMRLVGSERGYGEDLGLSRDWAARIIRHVGNYGEVYERNVGADSKLGIPRGLNQLWNAGGILYAPPIQ